ncbi:MAG TPA: diguanylate cyclase [Pseudonocardiaceae bacterium]|nr:diguanylate cyclase [Pseudonocardiaceae bacterium]
MVSRRGRTAADRLWLGYLVAGVLVVAAYYVALACNAPAVIGVVLYLSVSASGAVMVFIGCARNQPRHRLRLPWLLLGTGQAVYAAADAAFYVAHDLLGNDVYPSLADPLYLAHYPLVVIGLILLIRLRSPGRDLPGLLDAAALAVVAAMLSWVYLIGPLARIDEPVITRLVSAAYPVLDLVLLVFSFRLILVPSSRPASFLLLTTSLLAIFGADTVYVVQQLIGTYTSGNFLDGIWLAANLALGAAALHPTMATLDQRRAEPEVRIGPARLAILTTAALIAPTTLVLQGAFHALQDIPVIAAACAALCIFTIARLAGLLIDQRRLASTDFLTGLRTRRFIETQLPAEVNRAVKSGGAVSVLVVDVDNFASVNDRYGHQAGNRALREIARRLGGVIDRGDLLARYGGEEFVIVTTNSSNHVPGLAERARDRIANAPIVVLPEVWIAITVSVGAASFPGHGRTAAELLVSADRCLYAAKRRGGDQVVIGEGGRIPLVVESAGRAGPEGMLGYLRQLAQQVDGLGSERSRSVGRWAGLVAAELGLGAPAVRCAELAGELCDVGKVLVPRSISTKPDVLTTTERRIARAHAEHGHELIKVVPGLADAAVAVRQHHERWDGRGYPDGLAGDEIRIEARIVAVCDAWAAMISDRPFRSALDPDQACAELVRERGRQFDPEVVDAFVRLRERAVIGEGEAVRSAELS